MTHGHVSHVKHTSLDMDLSTSSPLPSPYIGNDGKITTSKSNKGGELISSPQSEGFDPSSLVKAKEGTMSVPEPIRTYLQKYLKCCLSKEEREALYKENPRPDLEETLPPKVDKFMMDFLGKKLPKEGDTDLVKIQTAVLACVRPLATAWQEMLDKTSEAGCEPAEILLPADQIISLIQRVICMVGNASEYISQARRAKILTCIDQLWTKFVSDPMASGSSGGNLFGQQFQSSLMDLVDKEVALSKAVSIMNRNKRPAKFEDTPSKKDRRPYKPFFRGSPAARYGGRQGRFQSSYQTPYQTGPRHRQNTSRGGAWSRGHRSYTAPRHHEPRLPESQNQGSTKNF